MKITITFTDDNAAFEDNGINEYGHVMTQVIHRVMDSETGTFTLMDSNGNSIGKATIKES